MNTTLQQLIRRDTVVAALRAEAALLEHLALKLRSLAEVLRQDGLDLFAMNNGKEVTRATLEHWKSCKERPLALIDLFHSALKAQPIFAGVSLCVRSTAPTIVAPVPYGLLDPEFAGTEDGSAFLNAFCISPGGLRLSTIKPTELEIAARSVSHALTNISYQVLLDETPVDGVLAAAHKSNRALYIPDVTKIHAKSLVSFGARNAATHEEAHLGMASVLYIPIVAPDAVAVRKGEPADAVVMLWSPTPQRWSEQFVPDDAQIVDVTDKIDLRRFNESLGWVRTIARRDDADLYRSELEAAGIMSAMRDWVSAHGQGVQFGEHFRAMNWLFSAIERPPHETTSVREWIYDILIGPEGFCNLLRQAWRDDPKRKKAIDLLKRMPVSLSMNPGPPICRLLDTSVEEQVNQLIALIAPDSAIGFRLDVAGHFASEPVHNIARFAESLDSIEVILAARYATIRYHETPKARDLERLRGSADAFRRYYAARRGFITTSGEDGRPNGGLGLWLYRIFAARMRVFRKLYLSVDGMRCHTDISMPLSILGAGRK